MIVSEVREDPESLAFQNNGLEHRNIRKCTDDRVLSENGIVTVKAKAANDTV